MIPLPLDFTATAQYTLDLSLFMQQGYISMVQSIYIDNQDSTVDLVIQVSTSQQRIVFPAGEQGYLPLLVPNPARVTFTCSGGPATSYVALLNFPVPAELWQGRAVVAQEFDGISTDAEVILSTTDFITTGITNGRAHMTNVGANTVTMKFYEWNRLDRADREMTDSFTIAAGAFATENVGVPYRFFEITIQSAAAGLPGEVKGGIFAT
jgi:hypothetical protein